MSGGKQMGPNDQHVDPEKPAEIVKEVQDDTTKPKHGFLRARKFEIFFLGSIVIVLISLFLIGFFPRLSHWAKLDEEANFTNPISVNILKLEPSKRSIELILPSTTQAHRVTPIWARIDGYIKDFYVDIGDHVEEGQCS
jgi:multidrug efflux pump subunit AcrA (membrane-fusion protein)